MSAPPPPPPPPPPLPTSHCKPSQSPLKLSNAISPLIQSLQPAPTAPLSSSNPTTPPTGPYFCYGTLMDPSLLRSILDLRTLPKLRPARILGYTVKLWGPYPALFRAEVGGEGVVGGEGEVGSVVERDGEGVEVEGESTMEVVTDVVEEEEFVVKGRVFEVESVEQAERLQEYESSAYRAVGVRILFADGEEPWAVEGWVFMFVGNPRDVEEGVWDLEGFLREGWWEEEGEEEEVDEDEAEVEGVE